MFLVTLLISDYRLLDGYQPLEPDGLIGVLTAKDSLYARKPGRVRLVKRNDGSRSRVVSINGRQDFEQSVIVASIQRPVALLIYSDVGNDTKKMQVAFGDVADTFKNQVRFVSMDLLEKYQNVPENYQIIGELMTMQNITRVGLPIILFFKDGDLYAPANEPAMMLQGFNSKEHLTDFLRNKFFNVKKTIIDATAQDLTHTSISTHQGPAPHNLEAGEKVDGKLSLGRRFLNLFKKK